MNNSIWTIMVALWKKARANKREEQIRPEEAGNAQQFRTLLFAAQLQGDDQGDNTATEWMWNAMHNGGSALALMSAISLLAEYEGDDRIQESITKFVNQIQTLRGLDLELYECLAFCGEQLLAQNCRVALPLYQFYVKLLNITSVEHRQNVRAQLERIYTRSLPETWRDDSH